MGDNVKKLKELKKNAINIIKEYNKIANKENFDSRLGLIKAEALFETKFIAEELDDPSLNRPKNINKHFKENGPYDSPICYDVEDNTGWFPSSICIGY